MNEKKFYLKVVRRYVCGESFVLLERNRWEAKDKWNEKRFLCWAHWRENARCVLLVEMTHEIFLCACDGVQKSRATTQQIASTIISISWNSLLEQKKRRKKKLETHLVQTLSSCRKQRIFKKRQIVHFYAHVLQAMTVINSDGSSNRWWISLLLNSIFPIFLLPFSITFIFVLRSQRCPSTTPLFLQLTPSIKSDYPLFQINKFNREKENS